MVSAPPDLGAWLGNGPRSEPQTPTGTVAQWSERLPGMWMGVIGRMRVQIRAAGLLLVLAAVLIHAGGDLSGPSAPPMLPAPLLPRGTRWQPLLLSRRRVPVPVITVRRFRSRSSHGGNTTASRQHGRLVCRRLLLLAGDIEVNPGPGSPAVQVAPPESASSLSVYHANVRSLKKQLGELRAFSPTLERHDVIAFTETWLNDTVATSELGLGLDDHSWFRRDRGSLGGGVACTVRSSLLPLRLPDPVDTETLLVRLRAVSVTLAVIYRPPDDDAAMERIADALSAVQPPDCRLVAVGDLNVPELSWTPAAGDADGAVPTERRAARRATKLVDMLNLLGLKQWVCQPTRGENLLDLVFTRRMLAKVTVQDSLFSTDHKETVAALSVPTCRQPVVNRRVALNYKRADFGPRADYYLSSNHLLSPTQHGFRPRHSTETALVSVADRILTASDQGEISLLCLIDLSKCFDVIDHSILLNKLNQYGVDTTWFASYLSGHSQKVSFTDKACKKHISKSLPISIGVFQGSSLGPLLFSLFSNDLSLFAADSDITQYADDTQVLVSGKKSALPALISNMETALATLDTWFKANSLKVNASKTQLMILGTRQNLRNVSSSNISVSFRDVPLKPCTEVKNLGLVFDKHLSWDQHISLLTRRCYGMLTGLVHLRHYLPEAVLSTVV